MPEIGASIANCDRKILHWPHFTSSTSFPGFMAVSSGVDDLENLALAGIDCNLHKGPNLTGIDPETRRATDLFHLRKQPWEDHFEWRGIYVIGKTAVGRTTVRAVAPVVQALESTSASAFNDFAL